MAITAPIAPGGQFAKRWTVTWALDADTVATIPHGIFGIPVPVYFTNLNPAAYIGQVSRTTVDATNIVLTKNAAVGSGGASVELIAFLPLSQT